MPILVLNYLVVSTPKRDNSFQRLFERRSREVISPRTLFPGGGFGEIAPERVMMPLKRKPPGG